MLYPRWRCGVVRSDLVVAGFLLLFFFLFSRSIRDIAAYYELGAKTRSGSLIIDSNAQYGLDTESFESLGGFADVLTHR